MKNRLIALVVLLTIMISACSKVPVTNRRQVNLLPESTMVSMSLTSYKDFLSQNKVVKAGKDAQMVKRVGNRIAEAATSYLRMKKKIKRVKNFSWEFNLVDDKAANAWAMPGGKVVFYTGILPITKTETGLAVVMGHEVAHAIARHGNERMSQGLAAQLGGLGLAIAMQNRPKETQDLFNQAYGLSSTVGMLKFSRKHESEADKMGLVFMAMAGYNPKEATKFWQRMKKETGGKGKEVPPFLSTHPSHETRIQDLTKFMPIAMKFYHPKK